MAETKTAVMKERLYSLVVQGWERDLDGHVGEHLGTRGVRVVAASNREAIDVARALLDPEGMYPPQNWAVVDGGELPPDSTDPAASTQKWTAWRLGSCPPQMNGVSDAP